ncbi:DUF2309 domain-containing protein [Pelagicoccus sp. SDUM812003]|uniref:YbcC family protein n=1 Tax=Pelagicoccus sp. SDUM812003 TaxID=3041267 RepID=UPI00280EEBB4|nr:DUF2309 domain-containing protein [Pelagicoccus sp. SDUM812003]MDQ8204220.1 DUF2309 domain-containing protein [Pelagicoccus sp. SDUM812003]
MKTNHNLQSDIEQAINTIAPLWPLTHFVAVNPFIGYADRPIWEASSHLKLSHGDYPLPALDYLHQQHTDGHVSKDCLQKAHDLASPAIREAFTQRDLRFDADTSIRLTASYQKPDYPEFQIGTFSAYLDRREGTRWNHVLKQEAGKWCAAHFDRGQSIWSSPWKEQSLFSGWRRFAAIDRNLSYHGLKNVQGIIASIPDSPTEAIRYVIACLEIPAERCADILERAFLELPGWSGYLRYLDRERELRGESDDNCLQLLAILLCYELVLYLNSNDDEDRILGWKRSLMEDLSDTGEPGISVELALRLLWQSAVELSVENHLRTQIVPQNEPVKDRPSLQAVFCIDVRSERFRRSLESVMPDAQTIGFAGFFGIPAHHHIPGTQSDKALCPALLAPPVKTAPSVSRLDCDEWISLQSQAGEAASKRDAWRRFRESAASCFTFVEAIGLSYLSKLLKASFPSLAKSDPSFRNKLVPKFLDALGQKQRLDLAETLLRGINLTENVAPIVLICGHGSETANNPYGSSLDCGACGGNAGDVNARLAVSLLNDKAIRSGLKARGIVIPDDSLFLAGIHNTTTDEVELFDTESIPVGSRAKVAETEQALKQAGDLCLLERRATLGIASSQTNTEQIRARSRDWSQVRPEWGLAGNEAFIVAPRSWTRASDLKGKAFLHEYDAGNDPDGMRLENILAGPLVVGSWINLQYFASASNNETYGSGQKTIHNVVGGIGVAIGNENDLKVGLPWQSVHDGKDFAHRPARLLACIAAEPATIDRILQQQPHLNDLVTNSWIHLVALGEQGDKWARRHESGQWLLPDQIEAEASQQS